MGQKSLTNDEAGLAGVKQFSEFGMPAFVSRHGNAERRAVLERNKQIREGNLDKPRNLGFAGVALSIPPLDYQVIKRMFPDLTSKDHEIRSGAWRRFARSPLSEPYRVSRIKRGPQCRSITAR